MTERIAFNLLYLTPGRVGGTEVYAHALLSALRQRLPADRLLLLVRSDTRDWGDSRLSDVDRVVVPFADYGRGARMVADAMLVDRIAQRAGASLVHSLGYHGPWSGTLPSVVTVHDTHFLHYTRASLRAGLLRYAIPKAIAYARRVICVSEFAAKELATLTPAHAARFRVVPHGPGSIATVGGWSPQINPPYLLAFSGLTANKNVERLLAAWSQIAAAHPTWELRLIGHPPPDLREHPPRVRFLGYVSDDAKVVQLRGAQSLVFPSTYEGFGLPVLEAMTLGVPVIASSTTAVGEVAGDAAIRVDPLDTRAIASAMASVMSDPTLCERFSHAGTQRATEFTWDRSAVQHERVYAEALRDAP